MFDSLIPDPLRSSKPTNSSRARHQSNERENVNVNDNGYGNLKSMGLKAGMLAVVAGLALYPKISSDAEVVEREQRMKRAGERNPSFRRREGQSQRGRRWREEEEEERRRVRRLREERERERERESDRGRRVGNGAGVGSGASASGTGKQVMRVDEYDMRRGEGFGYRDERRGREVRMVRRQSVEQQRRRDEQERDRDRDLRLPPGFGSNGNDRTRQWVIGGYEYLNDKDYRERDRRRW